MSFSSVPVSFVSCILYPLFYFFIGLLWRIVRYAIIQLGITHVLPVVVLVVTCPFSCISGCVAGLLDDMVYFEAVFGLRWMVL